VSFASLVSASGAEVAKDAHPSGGRLLVANKGDHTLSVIDPETGKTHATVNELGVTGHEVAASIDGSRAFVPIYGSGGVGRPGTDGRLMRVIDLKSHQVIGTVDFGHGVRPHCPVVGLGSGLVYVTTELDQTISVVDPHSLKIVRTLPTGQDESHMFALTRDEKRGYTANVGRGTVSAIDVNAGKVLKIIPVAKTIQRIALSADERRAFTSDQDQPRIAVIDTTANEVTGWIALPGVGFSAAATPDGRWLLVVLMRSNQLAVVDLAGNKVVRTLDLPRAPQEVLIRPDGLKAYISCDATKQVAVIDLPTWSVEKYLPAGAVADGLAWAVAPR
jgi:YVTN family beta-propeller protein